MNNEVNNDSVVSPENQNQTPVSSNPIDQTQLNQPVTNQPVNQPTMENLNNNAEQPNVNVQPIENPMPQNLNNNGIGGSTPKAKSIGIVPIILVAVVLIVLLVGITTRVVTSSPKAVFKGQINNAFKTVNNALDEYDKFEDKFDITSKGLLLKGSVKIDSNIESDDSNYELLKNLTMSGEFGVDINSEKLYFSGNIKGDKNTLGVSAYYQDHESYVGGTFLDKIVKVETDEEIDFDEIKDSFSQIKEIIEKVDTKTYNRIINKINKSLVNSLNSKDMKKSSGKIEVDGKSISATKNSLVLDEDALQSIIEKFCDDLLNDDEFLSDFAKVSELEKGDIKEALKELKESAKDLDMEEDLIVNIWTKGLLNSYVGISLEVDGKEYVSYYKNGKNAEFVIDNHVKEDNGKFKIVVSFVENKKEQEFTIKYNGEKVASGTIREFSDKLIDFDVSADIDGEKAKVSVYLSKEENKNSTKGDYKLRLTNNDEYIELSGDYEISTGDIPSVNTKDAVSIDDIDEEEVIGNVKELVEEDKALNGLIGSAISEYEKESLELNSYGMHPLYDEKDAVQVLKKNKASVLYVGSTFYSSYSEIDSYNLLQNLIDAQTTLGFHSNYLNYFYADEALKEATQNVNYTCHTSSTDTTATCSEYPTIYLVKDGEVKKAFRGTVTKEELEQALKEIGIGQ